MSPRACFTLLSILSLTGCTSPDDPEPELSSTAQEVGAYGADDRLGGNRLGGNRLGGNRLGGNRLGGNLLKPSALINADTDANGSLDGNKLFLANPSLDDEDTREFVSYLVSCALAEGDQVKFPTAGGTLVLEGDLGFAPEWKLGSCNLACQEKVTGCLLARVNYTGRGRAISVRLVGDQLSALEKNDHYINEGAFYGNLFDPNGAVPPLFYCHHSDSNRYCAEPNGSVTDCQSDSAIRWVGACDPGAAWPGDLVPGGANTKACASGLWDDGTYFYCSDGDHGDGVPAVTKTFTYAIASYSAVDAKYNVLDDACRHPDYRSPSSVTTAPLQAACSMCARKVSREGGLSHRTGAQINYRSSCVCPAGAATAGCKEPGYQWENGQSTWREWDNTCVANARDLCGDHSVCESGPAMFLGDSRCVDDICAADPYCCTNAWDSRCVAQATTVCKLDCKAYHPTTGTAGSTTYCTNDGSCGHGKGDCDSDADCAPGTACLEDVGESYGYTASTDVCVACHSGGIGGAAYCTPGCPCQAGEGHCESDSECVTGTRCVAAAGASYGWSPSTAVCERACHIGASGGLDYCSPECPCKEGAGDCETDDDCGAGLYCKMNVGSQYGFGATVDVCVPLGT